MNANKFELMYANVAQGQKDLVFAHLDEVVEYMKSHEWVSVKEIGIAVFGEKYNDPIYRGSYAPRLGAIMGKLVRNHYAESKQVETDGEPFEIERDKEEFVVLYKDEEFFTYKSEGWQVSYARFADNKNAKGYARKHIKEKKMMKPTIKMYRLLVKE